jgi:hypothetical protein
MANLQISKPEMLKRVARFKELVPSEYAFVDSKIPGHERLIYNVIGNGVTEDAALRPSVGPFVSVFEIIGECLDHSSDRILGAFLNQWATALKQLRPFSVQSA